MEKFKQVFVIVLDSLGVGALPDAINYGDSGANTLKHLSYSKIDFSIPNLEKLGIGNITEVYNTKPVIEALASYGKMKEMSVGKDTLTGHWELMGLKVDTPFPSFTEAGFPTELIKTLETQTGYKFIGNYAASGTEIIKELGDEHLKTGAVIVYTSADSVLQIAAHEDIVPLDELYKLCEVARKITLDNPKWCVGRIIARPFIGTVSNNFVRTSNRHDYAVKPFKKTVLNYLSENNYGVISVGKINDIFDGYGITESFKIKDNNDAMRKNIEIAKGGEFKDFVGLCFTNLVDFDALYGHRRDPVGYARCLESFDNQLSELMACLKDDALLILVADHGNDPTHSGTDHTREYVPLLVYNKNTKGVSLGVRNSFADVGCTIADNFNIPLPEYGSSFLKKIIKKKSN